MQIQWFQHRVRSYVEQKQEKEIASLRKRSDLLRQRIEAAYGLIPAENTMVIDENAEERILKEIERVRREVSGLNAKIDSLKDKDITDMKIEIATLKVKASIWGLIGGMVPVTILLIVQILRGG